ncbi:hypothetical protein EAG_01778 [Camponotus floridanus]|uniref:Uncharacterized protein n=1 Tax=Camponotus floridanus TaxID=104421 RepID=E2AGJ1_CAMFO|nr:hypothetical protein EAG_01778 [Camponotus floridanus]
MRRESPQKYSTHVGCYFTHSAQKCPVDPGNNSPCPSSRYVREANSGYVDELLAVFAIPAWNHGTDTFPTLVNAIERYSLHDYPNIRFADIVLPREKRALNFGDAEDPIELRNNLTGQNK